MFNARIDIFEISHEESVSYFTHVENLEKIRHTNGPCPVSLPIENKETVSFTSSVSKSSKNHKAFNMWCLYCDENNSRASTKFKQQTNTLVKVKAGPGKKSF
jgi:hypothetical protein